MKPPEDYFTDPDKKLEFFTNLLDWLANDPFSKELIAYLKFYGANHFAKNIVIAQNIKTADDYREKETEFLKNQSMTLAYQEIINYIGDPEGVKKLVESLKTKLIQTSHNSKP